jgi:thioester reductase-like protein
LNSYCFERVSKLIPNYEQFINDKIVGIEGDIVKENLGLSPDVKAMLIEECHVIINCAASVSFDDPLHDAIKINY